MTTTDDRRIAAPIHVPRPDGPWPGVHENMSELGNSVVYATWTEWLPTVLTTPQLRRLLGRDWTRYRRTSDPRVRYRFVASRLLIKYTAGVALGTPPESLEIAYRLGGRPHLRGLGQVEVSLTHTGDLMAVGLSRIGRIGIDSERADRKLRLDLLRSQMCTPAEAAEIAGHPEDEQSGLILRLWTLKEAYTKALGQGMRLGFTDFGFSLGSGRLLAPDGSPVPHREWAFATHPALGRYLLSVACHDTGLEPAGDLSVRTMLDQGFLSEMARRTGE